MIYKLNIPTAQLVNTDLYEISSGVYCFELRAYPYSVGAESTHVSGTTYAFSIDSDNRYKLFSYANRVYNDTNVKGNLIEETAFGQVEVIVDDTEVQSTVSFTNDNSITGSLSITGSFKFSDGTEQNGYVLTSDTTGGATWTSIAGVAGSSGTSGTSGPAGTSGAAGSSGTSGESGSSGTSGVSGAEVTGTQNYLVKFATTSSLGDSVLYEEGGDLGIRVPSPLANLHISSSGPGDTVLFIEGTSRKLLELIDTETEDYFQITTDNNQRLLHISASGTTYINTPIVINSSASFTGNLTIGSSTLTFNNGLLVTSSIGA